MTKKEILLELIRDKLELYENKTIGLSLKEIANAWNVDAEQEDQIWTEIEVFKNNFKHIAYYFIHEVYRAVKIIQDEKFIRFVSVYKTLISFNKENEENKEQSVEDIKKLSSINDIIYLEVIKNIHSTNEKDGSRKEGLESLHLITESLEPNDKIWLVLDERFEMPIRFAVKNSKGESSAIKKLYDIAYLVNVPNKKVSYDRSIADGINNGLFKKRGVAKYMKTNKFKKPTLVQKSESKTLVLKNEIPIKTILVKNIPSQYKSLYIDKTI